MVRILVAMKIFTEHLIYATCTKNFKKNLNYKEAFAFKELSSENGENK